MADLSQPVLSVRGLTKSYGATSVLKGVDFSVARGEVHALLGGNGAGKSTMIRIITGLAAKDAGEIRFHDAAGSLLSEAEGRSKVAVVHQELALLPHLTVAENLILPRLPNGFSLFDRKRAWSQAHEALCLIDREFADTSLNNLVGDLSLHQGQMVEIARALSSGAELLLLDEPTGNLTATETERLFSVLRRLTTENGLAVVFVSHRMKEIRQIAGVCTIIRDGKTVLDRVPTESLTDAAIVEKMGQLTARQAETGSPSHAVARNGNAAEDILVIREADLQMELTPGTILGVAGAPAGPQALISALVGAAKSRRWLIGRTGWPEAFMSPRQAARNGAGFVTGDRSHKGILANLPIIDNVMASRRIVSGSFFTTARERTECLDLVQSLKIKAASIWDLPETLSGGTQQKLLLARWLGLPSRLLVLEEPTRGVDIGTKKEIYQLIRQMAASGTIIVWWSTENAELLEVCDRVVAFDTDGRCVGIIEKKDLSEDTLANMTGMAA
ncbi:sugar ABC transporter ATP-binding protein [Agrobacterium rubi]|uniref:Putative ABC transporter ATP-binding protein n=1 Tax=Agrobacterium rubi TR3 = NBRC 13261 TaxID=1368415 RepID=A0A081D1L6_9HYPH|nr:sugar ABC transporter ATP-binding protein [Agrobacterium rubi]MBP1881239.1 ribose transport system ATP-binding protein [Agrobacterium rubi]MCL6652200.1 ABC transporter ATP-binding protein [Agrobacterium rubi]NTF09231.1 sugar ABC transporter ATP-binding protein [Agrobacterium rubi]NTF22140.1 sugar ABC transporter ATP-binding protein [Agrobacterium rubi]NTF28997.1 sugar ABC transporter ATP-binding protein [Agrobacterium rubi]